MDDDEPKMMGPKKTWTAEEWASYRKEPWAVRRGIDFLSLIPRGWMQWLVDREYKKFGAEIENCKRVAEKRREQTEPVRKPVKRKPKARSAEVVRKDVEEVQRMARDSLEVRGGFIGTSILFALRKGGKDAAEKRARVLLKGYTGDQIQELSIRWAPEVLEALAEMLSKDERFN